MATAAITLGIVGLFTWIIPPLGLLICIVGIILGTLALLTKTPNKKRAIAGVVTGSLGAVLSMLILTIGITALGMLGIFGEFLEQFMLYGPQY